MANLPHSPGLEGLSVKRKSEALERLTYQPYHTIRSSSAGGPWTAFTSILFGTGPVGPPDSTVQVIDCAGVDGQLHVCCTILDDWTNNFAPRNVRHALRMVTGDWTSFGDVRTTVLEQNPGSMDPGTMFSYVSCAVVAGELHACAQVEPAPLSLGLGLALSAKKVSANG